MKLIEGHEIVHFVEIVHFKVLELHFFVKRILEKSREFIFQFRLSFTLKFIIVRKCCHFQYLALSQSLSSNCSKF